jgi:hypothetical protein
MPASLQEGEKGEAEEIFNTSLQHIYFSLASFRLPGCSTDLLIKNEEERLLCQTTNIFAGIAAR